MNLIHFITEYLHDDLFKGAVPYLMIRIKIVKKSAKDSD